MVAGAQIVGYRLIYCTLLLSQLWGLTSGRNWKIRQSGYKTQSQGLRSSRIYFTKRVSLDYGACLLYPGTRNIGFKSLYIL